MDTSASCWTDATHALWERIQNHVFDRPGDGLTFTAKLAREHGWSREFSLRALTEYRRFAFLAIASGHPVTPSDAVDEVWHQHLIYTQDYWERFCTQVLQVPLHHGPSRGKPGEDRHYRQQYAQTLASYQQWFGTMPEDIWLSVQENFAGPGRFRRVDLARVLLLPRPRWPRATAIGRAAAMLALVAVAPSAMALSLNPLDWTAGPFLLFYAVLLVCAIGFGLRTRMARAAREAMNPSRAARSLGTYEVAYLSAGPVRVMDAGVAELLRQDRVQWNASTRKLQLVGSTSGLAFPIDRIAQQVRTDGQPRTLARRIEPALEPIRTTLVNAGLLLDAAQARALRTRAALPAALLAMFGAARMFVGVARGKPVGFIFVLTAVAAIFALVFWLKQIGRTREGDQALAQIRASNANVRLAPRNEDLALAVAMAGTAALASSAYADYHRARAPAGSGGDSSSSGGCSSSDSSSGDSGGGSCGSGCGGCGGGGGD